MTPQILLYGMNQQSGLASGSDQARQRRHCDEAIEATIGYRTISAMMEAFEIYRDQSLGDVLPDVLRHR